MMRWYTHRYICTYVGTQIGLVSEMMMSCKKGRELLWNGLGGRNEFSIWFIWRENWEVTYLVSWGEKTFSWSVSSSTLLTSHIQKNYTRKLTRTVHTITLLLYSWFSAPFANQPSYNNALHTHLAIMCAMRIVLCLGPVFIISVVSWLLIIYLCALHYCCYQMGNYGYYWQPNHALHVLTINFPQFLQLSVCI